MRVQVRVVVGTGEITCMALAPRDGEEGREAEECMERSSPSSLSAAGGAILNPGRGPRAGGVVGSWGAHRPRRDNELPGRSPPARRSNAAIGRLANRLVGIARGLASGLRLRCRGRT